MPVINVSRHPRDLINRKVVKCYTISNMEYPIRLEPTTKTFLKPVNFHRLDLSWQAGVF